MIIYTKHALERMYQRGISKGSIDSISPEEFTNNHTKDRLGHFILQVDIDGYLLRIFYRKEDSDIMIITAYKTSKLDKYKN